MTPSGRTDVFLSYSKADAAVAAEMADALEQSGLSVWWDAYLSPVKPFEETLKNVIRHSEIILGILSPTSLQSPWVRWELAQAHEQGLKVVLLLTGGVLQRNLPPPLDRLRAFFLNEERSPAAIAEIADSVRSVVHAVRSDAGTENSQSRKAKIDAAAERLAEVAVGSTGGPPGVSTSDERDYLCSNGFQSFLRTHSVSIAFTAFPLSLLFFIRQDGPGGEMLTASHAPDVRALHSDGGKFLVGCDTYIAEMADVSRTGETVEGKDSHFFVPKIRHVTGNLDTHDIAHCAPNHVLFANTRYSCLSRVSRAESVRPVWTPCFISELVPEDRCHLNGIAMRDGEPAYVSAAAPTDVIDGWRQRRADGGVVIDVARNEVICEGLSMPHSPRFHANRLWVLNSGAGELGVVEERASGGHRFEALAFLPGFLRGLTFVGPYAIVGLSKPRYEVFEGLPLHDRLQEKGLPPWSGIAIVDIRDGRCVEWFRLTGRVWEVSDVAVLPGVSRPTATFDTSAVS